MKISSSVRVRSGISGTQSVHAQTMPAVPEFPGIAQLGEHTVQTIGLFPNVLQKQDFALGIDLPLCKLRDASRDRLPPQRTPSALPGTNVRML